MKKSKSKKIFLALIVGSHLWLASPTEAQRVYHIGSLNSADQFVNSFEGFKNRMAELGYVEGRNVRYDFYNAKGSDEALNSFAQKLVQDKVDLIVTSATSSTVAAAKATEGTNIPVVFLSAGNPQKLVKSFASSGSNLAGISSATLELTGKRFELFRELAPGIKRIAVFYNPKGVNYQASLMEIQDAAKKLGFTLLDVHATNREEVVKVAPTVTRRKADGIYTAAEAVITGAIEAIVEQSIKERMPLVTALLANVEKGCLATYAADYFLLGQQGAILAEKIFKGIKPSDLPIELPSKFKLAINLKTAKAIGLKVPRELLLRADEVIQ